MYKAMKTLIDKKFYKTADIVQNKLNVFFSVNQLTDDEYIELTAMVKEFYLE